MSVNRSQPTQLARELDSLPLPPRESWVPSAPGAGDGGGLALLAGALVVVVIALSVGAVAGGRAASNGAAVTPPVYPTLVDGRRVFSPPWIFRSATHRYTLTLPAQWHHSAALSQATAIGALRARDVFTARDDTQSAALAASDAARPLPWDVAVEVWANDGSTLAAWALAHEPCGDCPTTTVQIHGMPAVVVTSALGRAYYLGDAATIFVIRYVARSDPPTGVTTASLAGIAESFGRP